MILYIKGKHFKNKRKICINPEIFIVISLPLRRYKSIIVVGDSSPAAGPSSPTWQVRAGKEPALPTTREQSVAFVVSIFVVHVSYSAVLLGQMHCVAHLNIWRVICFVASRVDCHNTN